MNITLLLRIKLNDLETNMTDNWKCVECGKEIQPFEKYYKHNRTGEILHKKCYEKLIKEGKIQ